MLGLGWSLFARRYWGNRGCFLLLQVLRCFTSLSGPRTPMDLAHDTTAFPVVSCLIRVSSGHGLLAAGRGLLQLGMLFVASCSLCIHISPFVHLLNLTITHLCLHAF